MDGKIQVGSVVIAGELSAYKVAIHARDNKPLGVHQLLRQANDLHEDYDIKCEGKDVHDLWELELWADDGRELVGEKFLLDVEWHKLNEPGQDGTVFNFGDDVLWAESLIPD